VWHVTRVAGGFHRPCYHVGVHTGHMMPWAHCITLGMLMVFASVQEPLASERANTGAIVAAAGGLFVLLGVMLLAATLGA
jgi:drug/metabolite transporter superfamily protein YnfA